QGEVSSLGFTMTYGRERITDYRFSAEVLPVGHYEHDVRDANGGLRGYEVVGGIAVGYEYGAHDFDRDDTHRPNRIALVDAGTSVEHTLFLGGTRLRMDLALLADFGGVDAYALPEYERARQTAQLSSIMAHELYYHAYGATLRPGVRLERGRFDAGV